jgi:hypothetical protein
VETKKKVNSQPEIIQSQSAYNGIGQLKTKHLHAVDDGANIAAQTIHYTYNPRGWLKSLSSEAFESELNQQFELVK